MEQSFVIPARIGGLVGHAARIVEAIGDGYRRGLVLSAVHEALTNAVIYGALRIPASERGRDVDELLGRILAREATEPEAVVHAAVMKLGDGSGDAVVRVSDCGPGFDWRSWLRFRRQVASPSVSWSNVPTWGRGLVIMQAGARAMWWNEQGNEVSLRFSVREGGDCCASERSSGGRARGG